jgi:hypothetical protein
MKWAVGPQENQDGMFETSRLNFRPDQDVGPWKWLQLCGSNWWTFVVIFRP